jgi:hypothetical protein
VHAHDLSARGMWAMGPSGPLGVEQPTQYRDW